jgi:hypothetical protein
MIIYEHKYLDKFANMSLEERAEAFTVVSASPEEIDRVLNSAHPEKLDYIMEKIEPHMGRVESLSSELSSKGTGYLVTHLKYAEKKAAELEDAADAYTKRILTADREYDINMYSDEPYFDDSRIIYNPNAHQNVTAVRDELINLGKKAEVVSAQERMDGKEVGERDLIQSEIQSRVPHVPIFRYFQIINIFEDEIDGTPNIFWVLRG